MSDHQIVGLFPTPLYHAKLDREFSALEKSFVEKEAGDPDENIRNMIGKGKHVLSDPAMTDLRMFIERHIRIFMREVYAPSSPVYAYLTQSWLNYTYPGQAHHAHMHDNSFISGVLYINAHGDSLKFMSGRGHAIRITTDDYNIFNKIGRAHV